MSIAERYNAAMDKLEAATTIWHTFNNGPEDGSVATESGNIPTLARIAKDLSELGNDVEEFIGEVTQTLDELPEQPEE